jgi:hypothetical protein
VGIDSGGGRDILRGKREAGAEPEEPEERLMTEFHSGAR